MQFAAIRLVLILASILPGCAPQDPAWTALFLIVGCIPTIVFGIPTYLILSELIGPDPRKVARFARTCWIVFYVGCGVSFFLGVYLHPSLFAAPLFPALVGALASRRAGYLDGDDAAPNLSPRPVPWGPPVCMALGWLAAALALMFLFVGYAPVLVSLPFLGGVALWLYGRAGLRKARPNR